MISFCTEVLVFHVVEMLLTCTDQENWEEEKIIEYILKSFKNSLYLLFIICKDKIVTFVEKESFTYIYVYVCMYIFT